MLEAIIPGYKLTAEEAAYLEEPYATSRCTHEVVPDFWFPLADTNLGLSTPTPRTQLHVDVRWIYVHGMCYCSLLVPIIAFILGKSHKTYQWCLEQENILARTCCVAYSHCGPQKLLYRVLQCS